MTATVTVTWATQNQNFANGTVFGGYRVTLSGGAAPLPAPVTVPASPAVIAGLQFDTPTTPYLATIQLMMADGVTPAGAPTTVSFTALQPAVGAVPIGASVSVLNN